MTESVVLEYCCLEYYRLKPLIRANGYNNNQLINESEDKTKKKNI